MTENKEKVQETVPTENIETKAFQLNDQSQTIGKLAKAMARFQVQLVPATKSSVNPFSNSNYSDISEVLKACQRLLGESGIALNQGSHTDLSTGLFSVYTQLTHESGEWMRTGVSVSRKNNKGQMDNHSIGSALTYGRRYSLAAMVGISQEDDDANSTVDEAPHKRNNTKSTAEVAHAN